MNDRIIELMDKLNKPCPKNINETPCCVGYGWDLLDYECLQYGFEGAYYSDEEFNFCPMCGRSLKTKEDE